VQDRYISFNLTKSLVLDLVEYFFLFPLTNDFINMIKLYSMQIRDCENIFGGESKSISSMLLNRMLPVAFGA
jgi:hypothetical protein